MGTGDGIPRGKGRVRQTQISDVHEGGLNDRGRWIALSWVVKIAFGEGPLSLYYKAPLGIS